MAEQNGRGGALFGTTLIGIVAIFLGIYIGVTALIENETIISSADGTMSRTQVVIQDPEQLNYPPANRSYEALKVPERVRSRMSEEGYYPPDGTQG